MYTTLLQKFSEDLLDAHRGYADRLQGADPRADLKSFHDYLCRICDLVARSITAESCSILMRGSAEPRKYPKGSLSLVACNKQRSGEPDWCSSVWNDHRRAGDVTVDLAVDSITKRIYQGRVVQSEDYKSIIACRGAPVGQFDLDTWTGQSLWKCFRNYLGLPIHIQPHAQPVGILKVENKRYKDDAYELWTRVGEYSVDMSPEEAQEARDERNKALDGFHEQNQLPLWESDDAPLIALAASYVAKVEELRLTMLAAQHTHPIPLDSRDFAYLRVCDSSFAESASTYLEDRESNERVLTFFMGGLLSNMRRQARPGSIARQELDAVRFKTRVKNVRSLFERLRQRNQALNVARRILAIAECGMSLRRESTVEPNEFSDELTRLSNVLVNCGAPRLEFTLPEHLFRDADYTTPPLRLDRETISTPITLLIGAMKTTAFAEPPQSGDDCFVNLLHSQLPEPAIKSLCGGHIPRTLQAAMAHALLRYYDRHARRQLSYLIQLLGIAEFGEDFASHYRTTYAEFEKIAEAIQFTNGESELVLSDGLFDQRTADRVQDLSLEHREPLELQSHFAAAYKRARHLLTIQSQQRSVPELTCDTARHDSLGCRFICWFERTRSMLAREVILRDAAQSEPTERLWIVQRLRSLEGKDDGYTATHLSLLLPPSERGSEAESRFRHFAEGLGELGRELFSQSWPHTWDHLGGNPVISPFDRIDQVEFLVHLLDGRMEASDRSARLGSHYGSWYQYYLELTSVEVQIRTALMDTWADQYHDPVYKGLRYVTATHQEQLSMLGKNLSDIGRELEEIYED